MRFYDKYNSDDKVSEFNEAALKMMRLDRIQDHLNELWVYPTAYNVELARYNYEIIQSLIESLYQEVRPKMRDEEKKKGEQYIEIIDRYMEEFPPHKEKRQIEESKKEFDRSNWRKIKKALRTFESFVRHQLDNHGFGSPNKDDVKGL